MKIYYTTIKPNNVVINNVDWQAIIFQQAQLEEEVKTICLETITSMRDVETITDSPSYQDKAWLDRIYNIIKYTNINPDEHYQHFTIPKTSGGVRDINSPDDALRNVLKHVRQYFEVQCKMLPHNSAYAYFKTRSIKNALEVHQNNNSNWFAKIDMSNFFPSITTEVLFTQLKKLYPFYKFDDEMLQKLKEVCKFCTLHDRLPQGAETSPLLSNLIMIPFDYHMTKWAYMHHFRYTRYADDILLSNKQTFNIKQIENVINHMLTDLGYPMQINQQKTRYGSKNGQNWNLGLMLNQQNQITLGYKKKECLRAALNNFLKAWTNNEPWDIMSTHRLMGELNYFHMIEPEYADKIFTKLQNKYNVASWKQIAIQIIRG